MDYHNTKTIYRFSILFFCFSNFIPYLCQRKVNGSEKGTKIPDPEGSCTLTKKTKTQKGKFKTTFFFKYK